MNGCPTREMVLRAFRFTILGAVLSVVFVPPANARTYCVGIAPGTGNCPSSAAAAADLQSAFDVAIDSTSDTIVLGPGAFFAPQNGFVAAQGQGRLTIVGQGRSVTTVSAASGTTPVAESVSHSRVLDLRGRLGTVSGIRVEIPTPLLPFGPVAGSTEQTGIDTDGAFSVEDVSIATASSYPRNPYATPVGIRLANGAMLRRSQVLLVLQGGSTGVLTEGSEATLEDVSVSRTQTGVRVDGGSVAIRRARVEALNGLTASGASVVIQSSLIAPVPGRTLDAAVRAAATTRPMTLTVIGSTIVGSGQLPEDGISVSGGSSAVAASADVRSSIIDGVATPIRVADASAATVSSSDVRRIEASAVSAAGRLTSIDTVDVDPQFADPAAGQYSLAASSPLIDRGGHGTDQDDDLDLAGTARVTDGDGDGVPVIDIGAFERPARAATPSPTPAATGPVEDPVVPAATAAPEPERTDGISAPTPSQPTVVVPKPPHVDPRPRLEISTARRITRRGLTKRGLFVKLRCTTRCRATARLKSGGTTLVSKSLTGGPGRTRQFRLRVNARAAREFPSRARYLLLTASATADDQAAIAGPKPQRLAIRP